MLGQWFVMGYEGFDDDDYDLFIRQRDDPVESDEERMHRRWAADTTPVGPLPQLPTSFVGSSGSMVGRKNHRVRRRLRKHRGEKRRRTEDTAGDGYVIGACTSSASEEEDEEENAESTPDAEEAAVNLSVVAASAQGPRPPALYGHSIAACLHRCSQRGRMDHHQSADDSGDDHDDDESAISAVCFAGVNLASRRPTSDTWLLRFPRKAGSTGGGGSGSSSSVTSCRRLTALAPLPRGMSRNHHHAGRGDGDSTNQNRSSNSGGGSIPHAPPATATATATATSATVDGMETGDGGSSRSSIDIRGYRCNSGAVVDVPSPRFAGCSQPLLVDSYSYVVVPNDSKYKYKYKCKGDNRKKSMVQHDIVPTTAVFTMFGASSSANITNAGNVGGSAAGSQGVPVSSSAPRRTTRSGGVWVPAIAHDVGGPTAPLSSQSQSSMSGGGGGGGLLGVVSDPWIGFVHSRSSWAARNRAGAGAGGTRRSSAVSGGPEGCAGGSDGAEDGEDCFVSWERLTCVNRPPPAARCFASLVPAPTASSAAGASSSSACQEFWLFGGTADGREPLTEQPSTTQHTSPRNDDVGVLTLLIVDPAERQLTHVRTACAGSAPSPRFGHAAAIVPYTGATTASSTAPSSYLPTAADGDDDSAAVIMSGIAGVGGAIASGGGIGGRMYIYGGVGRGRATLGDMSYLDSVSMTWREVFLPCCSVDVPRVAFHCMTPFTRSSATSSNSREDHRRATAGGGGGSGEEHPMTGGVLLHIAGGEVGGGAPMRACFVFDPDDSSWTEQTFPLLISGASPACTTAGGHTVVAALSSASATPNSTAPTSASVFPSAPSTSFADVELLKEKELQGSPLLHPRRQIVVVTQQDENDSPSRSSAASRSTTESSRPQRPARGVSGALDNSSRRPLAATVAEEAPAPKASEFRDAVVMMQQPRRQRGRIVMHRDYDRDGDDDDSAAAVLAQQYYSLFHGALAQSFAVPRTATAAADHPLFSVGCDVVTVGGTLGPAPHALVSSRFRATASLRHFAAMFIAQHMTHHRAPPLINAATTTSTIPSSGGTTCCVDTQRARRNAARDDRRGELARGSTAGGHDDEREEDGIVPINPFESEEESDDASDGGYYQPGGETDDDDDLYGDADKVRRASATATAGVQTTSTAGTAVVAPSIHQPRQDGQQQQRALGLREMVAEGEKLSRFFAATAHVQRWTRQSQQQHHQPQ